MLCGFGFGIWVSDWFVLFECGWFMYACCWLVEGVCGGLADGSGAVWFGW